MSLLEEYRHRHRYSHRYRHRHRYSHLYRHRHRYSHRYRYRHRFSHRYRHRHCYSHRYRHRDCYRRTHKNRYREGDEFIGRRRISSSSLLLPLSLLLNIFIRQLDDALFPVNSSS